MKVRFIVSSVLIGSRSFSEGDTLDLHPDFAERIIRRKLAVRHHEAAPAEQVEQPTATEHETDLPAPLPAELPITPAEI